MVQEFLPARELETLTRFVLARERRFERSGILRYRDGGAAVASDHRRSRVLYDLGALRSPFLDRMLAILPQVFAQLRITPFALSAIDTQITATNDGEFFRRHTDNGHPLAEGRRVSFTYFFHREPRGFAGGELCLYAGGMHKIVPRRNGIVFFPSGILHEIAPVSCPSQRLCDSRLTVNGWIYEKINVYAKSFGREILRSRKVS